MRRLSVPGLDGLRGFASLYVVLFHCWLLSFSGFPENTGPWWLEWLMYGRLAVVFFLVLSGFSLALGPARDDWQLGSTTRFLRRRAWRILPPYWAALIFSLLVAYFVVPASHAGPPTGRTVVVYGLVLQDVLTAPTPNGAFWSIAVEAELYLLFPLLLLLRRKLGVVALIVAVTLPVVSYGIIAGPAAEGMNWLMPNLAPVFVAGIVAAGATSKLPWQWLAAAVGLPIVVLIAINGPVWTVERFFWVDLAVAVPMAMLLAAVANGRPVLLVRLLAVRAVRHLGKISYSLYLVHLLIVMILCRVVAPEFLPRGLPTFGFAVLVGVPLSIVAAHFFAKVFEMPFQRARSWKALAAEWPGRRKPVMILPRDPQ